MSESISSGIDILYRGQNAINKDDYDAYVNRWEAKEKEEKLMEDKSTLSFTDMLSLMVAQFQNQTIDNQADASDMMNQLVQMTVVQAMTDMTTQMKEVSLANVMSYSASLVGQTVTLGIYDEKGNLTELVGVVEGAGTYDGQQVIFVDGKSYALSSIMAVGKLPPIKTEDSDKDDNKTEETDKDGETEGTQKPEGSDGATGDKPVEKPDETTEDNNEEKPDDKVDEAAGTEGA